MGCRDAHIQHGQPNDCMGRIGTLNQHKLDPPACKYSTSSLTDDIVDCCLNGVWRVLVTSLLFIRQFYQLVSPLHSAEMLLWATFPTVIVCVCISLIAVDVKSLELLGSKAEVVCAKQKWATQGKIVTKSRAC